MIRNLFLLGFATCLIDISQCDKDFVFKSSADGNFDAYEEYEGSPRMQYSDYDPSDRSEYQAGSSVNTHRMVDEGNKSVKTQGHPPISVTNSKTGGPTILAVSKKPLNKAKVVAKTPANNKTKKPSKVLEVETGPKNAKFEPKTVARPTNVFPSWINTPSNGSSNTVPLKKFVDIFYYVYRQNYDSPDINIDLPKFPLNNDVYIMVHGFMKSEDPSYQQEDYVRQFFTSISSVILDQCNCTVIGVRWSFKEPPRPKSFIQYRAAAIAGKKLAKAINGLRSKVNFNASLTLIGHDLGNLAVAHAAGMLRKPVDYIYGLDQRPLEENYRNFYLRQDLGRVVQTLTTNGLKYNYGHRNFYPDGGNISSVLSNEVGCFYCYSFQLLSDAISRVGGDHYSTFCTSYKDYLMDYCEQFPQVSYYNRIPANQLPPGNYFITEELKPSQFLLNFNE